MPLKVRQAAPYALMIYACNVPVGCGSPHRSATVSTVSTRVGLALANILQSTVDTAQGRRLADQAQGLVDAR